MSSAGKHYLLDGFAGWQAARLNSVAPNARGGLTLQSVPGSGRPLVDAAGSLGGLQAAIGVAVDRQDRVYILDGADCRIKMFDRCLERFVRLHCVGGSGSAPREFASPNGIAVSRHDDLYVADTGNYRVQIFALNGLALRDLWGPLLVTQKANSITVAPAVPTMASPGTGDDCDAQLEFPAGTWQPWDVAIGHRNQAYVTDYANGLVHMFDAAGCWRRAFTGAGPSQPQLVNPTRIAVDRQNRIYVIQEGQSYVVVLDKHGNCLGQVTQPSEIQGRFCPVAVAVDLNGNLCLSDCMTRKVYFYQPTGDDGWCGYRCTGCASSFAASMVFDLTGMPLLANGAESVCQLQLQAAYPIEGLYYSTALDSKTYQCQWHRVALRASVPAGCTIQVDTFAAESPKSIDEVLNLPASRWSTGQLDANANGCDWDCLILSPPGRYLWLRLTLSGEGVSTPCIETVRVYYPRASSLQYLPAVFRADPVSGDFMARFLSIFDTLRNRTSAEISGMFHYFDPMATPANKKNQSGTDFLSWLAGWLGLSLQSNWPVHKRRELVRQAHKLFAQRGTPEGMKLQIELYTGVKPRILEMFRMRRWLLLNSSTLGNCSTVFGAEVMQRLEIGINSTIGNFQLIDFGDPSLDLFNAYAYQFLVVVPRWPGMTPSDEQAVQQIVDMAAPAYTVGKLQWAEPKMRIGIQSFIGVDTIIGRYPLGVIEGQSQLGYDAVLGNPADVAVKPPLRVGSTTVVGCGTALN